MGLQGMGKCKDQELNSRDLSVVIEYRKKTENGQKFRRVGS